MSSNWCETCQEACHDHPTMCSICGETLVVRPSDEATNSNANSSHGGFASTEARLLNDMREASRDLRNILGSLRGQVQDLDVLTRNILEDGNNLPREIWDPQNASTNPASRPTSKEHLKKIPRFVLNAQSTLYRQITLRVDTDIDWNGISSIAPAASGVDNDSLQRISTAQDIGLCSSPLSAAKPARTIDCIPGEFGCAKEYKFEMGTSLVLASPVTGKGGLTKETKTIISQLNACASKVIVLMQRGDGLTFARKARMAQDAGAAAVIIANNTSNPWPYVMKDTKGEANKPGKSISIPVAMIKKEDYQDVIKLFERKKKMESQRQRQQPKPPIPNQIILENNKGSHAQHQIQIQSANSIEEDIKEDYDQIDYRLSCELIVTAQSCDCPVCCEKMQPSEKVIQLEGCGHIFHEECALAWLKSHNTCPYCRRELPTDDPEYDQQRRREQQQDQEQRMHFGNTGARDPMGGSFYG